MDMPSHSHSIYLLRKSTATSRALCLGNFGCDFFIVSLQLYMVNGKVLCSNAVGILLDVNNTKKRQQLSLFLNFSVWKIKNPILIQIPPSRSHLKGKLNVKTVNDRR